MLPGWNGLNDVVAKSLGILSVPDRKRLDRTERFPHRLQPHSVGITAIVRLGSVLYTQSESVLLQFRPLLAHRWPIACGGSGEKWLAVRLLQLVAFMARSLGKFVFFIGLDKLALLRFLVRHERFHLGDDLRIFYGTPACGTRSWRSHRPKSRNQ